MPAWTSAIAVTGGALCAERARRVSDQPHGRVSATLGRQPPDDVEIHDEVLLNDLVGMPAMCVHGIDGSRDWQSSDDVDQEVHVAVGAIVKLLMARDFWGQRVQATVVADILALH